MIEAGHDTHMKPPRLRWRWIKIFLLAGAILASGIVIGMALMLRFVGPPMKLHAIPERAPEFIAQSLHKELSLDDNQAKAVLEIFKEDREKLEGIRVKVDSEVLGQLEATQEKIHHLLRPEQREKFDKRFEKIKSDFRPGSAPKQ